MVTLNFTLVVELGLFLLFLWGTKAFVLRPVLRLLDTRDETIGEWTEEAAAKTEHAEALEREYAETIVAYHHEADERFREAYQAASNRHLDALHAARLEADAAVARVRAESMRQREQQREAIAAAAPELAAMIRERLAAREAAHG